jgi:hypothetical protein
MIAGSAIIVAAIGGAAFSPSVASAAETAVFNGTGGAGPLSSNDAFALAEARAVAKATVTANAAGFFECPTHEITNIAVSPPSGNMIWLITVALTCTR